MRPDRRATDELRSVTIEVNPLRHPEGSALISCGDTRVMCTATVEERIPPWMDQKGSAGWVTAEYAMLPRATTTRTNRNSGGREKEIQRLVGRSLRAAVDLAQLGRRTVIIDCDVLQADGGTRTASITGGFVAFALAMARLLSRGLLTKSPIRDLLAAVSVGIVDGEARLDLMYEEDSAAQVDLNVVMTGSGHFVELQGTAEKHPFDTAGLESMLALARTGIARLVEAQRKALGDQLRLVVRP
jgi:ribonuclease PH